jgi:hypothetical protein
MLCQITNEKRVVFTDACPQNRPECRLLLNIRLADSLCRTYSELGLGDLKW